MTVPPAARPDDGAFLRAAAWAWAWRSFDIGLPDTPKAPDAAEAPESLELPQPPGAPEYSEPSKAPGPAAGPPCPVRNRPRPVRRRRGCRP
ncbi:hypothetical protein GCM10010293_52140 [Streptomyces griseoflavus]|nr:hypothetical protein GCM10010293_52140 [Streptomyces griseoflavus]